jgi:hypothetical protein
VAQQATRPLSLRAPQVASRIVPLMFHLEYFRVQNSAGRRFRVQLRPKSPSPCPCPVPATSESAYITDALNLIALVLALFAISYRGFLC